MVIIIIMTLQSPSSSSDHNVLMIGMVIGDIGDGHLWVTVTSRRKRSLALAVDTHVPSWTKAENHFNQKFQPPKK